MMMRLPLLLSCLAPLGSSFVSSRSSFISSRRLTNIKVNSMATSLVEPSEREVEYGGNIAQYLVDLHDQKGTFDFCGGMMFQLMLSNTLRDYLVKVAGNTTTEQQQQQQPVVFDSSKSRMFQVPDYSKSADADNVRIFHGRELRKIPDVAGGFGFVLHLSMANEDDPEGWSKEEISTYDGWGSDVGRQWRKANDYESEGFVGFKEKFGTEAFGLNHRFYLHFDSANRMWLSAEDGCEGVPAQSNPLRRMQRMFGF